MLFIIVGSPRTNAQNARLDIEFEVRLPRNSEKDKIRQELAQANKARLNIEFLHQRLKAAQRQKNTVRVAEIQAQIKPHLDQKNAHLQSALEYTIRFYDIHPPQTTGVTPSGPFAGKTIEWKPVFDNAHWEADQYLSEPSSPGAITFDRVVEINGALKKLRGTGSDRWAGFIWADGMASIRADRVLENFSTAQLKGETYDPGEIAEVVFHEAVHFAHLIRPNFNGDLTASEIAAYNASIKYAQAFYPDPGQRERAVEVAKAHQNEYIQKLQSPKFKPTDTWDVVEVDDRKPENIFNAVASHPGNREIADLKTPEGIRDYLDSPGSPLRRAEKLSESLSKTISSAAEVKSWISHACSAFQPYRTAYADDMEKDLPGIRQGMDNLAANFRALGLSPEEIRELLPPEPRTANATCEGRMRSRLRSHDAAQSSKWEFDRWWDLSVRRLYDEIESFLKDGHGCPYSACSKARYHERIFAAACKDFELDQRQLHAIVADFMEDYHRNPSRWDSPLRFLIAAAEADTSPQGDCVRHAVNAYKSQTNSRNAGETFVKWIAAARRATLQAHPASPVPQISIPDASARTSAPRPEFEGRPLPPAQSPTWDWGKAHPSGGAAFDGSF